MQELITAIIKPHQVTDVKDALIAAGVQGMTVTEVRGFGRQRGKTEVYRGSEYTVDFIPKVKLEVLVEAEDADRIIEVIQTAAQTEKIGDGKIWSVSIDKLMRVRTGERGSDAI
jgi:nitrogen regulatory protein P-II 1